MRIMESENFPVIITAAAGIVGVIINVLINVWSRYNDIKVKSIERNIEALEVYYVPLRQYLVNIWRSFCALKSLEPNTNVATIIIDNSSFNTSVDVNKLVQSLYKAVECLSDFRTQNDKYKFIQDYKLSFYYDKTMLLIDVLQSKSKDFAQYNADVSFNCIEKLIARIDILFISIYSRNFFHRTYLYIWRHFQSNK